MGGSERISSKMNVLPMLIVSVALGVSAVQAKDGHREPSSGQTVKATPNAWSSHTYYSYSYKAPGTSSKSSSVRASQYLHKADTVAQRYNVPTPSSKVSSANLATKQQLNTVANAALAAALTQIKK